MLGHFAGTAFPFHLLLTVLWTKLSTWTVFVATVTLRYNDWSDSAPAYNLGVFMLHELPASRWSKPGPDYLGSTDECLGPGRDSSANNGTSMSWLVPVLCSAISLFATWVVRK